MPRSAVVLFDDLQGKKLLERYCEQLHLTVADLEELIELVIDMEWKQRRRGLFQAFDEILDRTLDLKENLDVSPSH